MADLRGLPKAIPFLIGCEFCERFNFNGLRAIISLYITEELHFSEEETVVIYHLYAMVLFTMPIIGGIIADSWWGKYKTILYISLVYACGNIVLALSAIVPLNLPPTEFFMFGLALIAFGTGGIKPCVSAFGGDQFELPGQAKYLDIYFHLFYFTINIGSFSASVIIPILRKRVYCFGKHSCYSLAYGLPGILMFLAVVLLVAGKPLYKIRQPEGNMLVKISMCIGNAIKTKCKSRGVQKEHWLDYAIEEHGEKLVNEIKTVLKVLILYIPLPFFWGLFEQMATSWVFQARRLDGDVGELFTITPDQLAAVNPITVLILIPMFEYFIYPFFEKFGLLTKPLQRIATGGILVAVAFVISAFLAIAIEADYPILPRPGKAQMRIFNVLPCDITVNCEKLKISRSIPTLSHFTMVDIAARGVNKYSYSMTSSCSSSNGEFLIEEHEASAYYFKENNKEAVYENDAVDKLLNSRPNSRVVVNLNGKLSGDVYISYLDYHNNLIKTFPSLNTSLSDLPFPGIYSIKIGDFVTKYRFKRGGVYTTLAIAEAPDKFAVKTIAVTAPNSIHILWMLPQLIVITAAEIMFSVTGLEFAYSQAPKSMKSVLQAFWFLTYALGQVVVIVIEAVISIELQSHMFLLYAGIMVIDMLFFIVLCIRYKYVVPE